MNDVEIVIDLLLDAAQPRSERRPGELDRRRAQQIASWRRLNAAGMLEEADLLKLVQQFDSGLDYQMDHPLNEIDATLDSAMALARGLDADAHRDLSGLVDAPVRRRLGTYSVRCASRALAGRSANMCEAGLLAVLLAIDPEDNREDPRDLMVSLAPLHVAARGTYLAPAALFGKFSEFVPAHVGETLMAFGRRADVTLSAFGWARSQSYPVQWIIIAD